MHAAETKIQAIIDTQRQYVIPLFQRPYSWKSRNWAALWQDLAELCEEEISRNHFIGSIVTMPSTSLPHGVTKYILIDGQQRMTTLLVLLAAIRDKARSQSGNLADKIDELLLKNRYQEGNEVYKVLPTQVDRPAFCAIMDETSHHEEAPITAAYDFFARKLRLNSDAELEKLHNIIRNHLVLVSIVLDKDDNPYLIFESLNGKGEPLTQADLIRNFFFMRLHVDIQQKMYAQHWLPMQDRLGENLTEYIRHFLMREGKVVRQNDVYQTLKARIEDRNDEGIISYMEEVATFSRYYAKLLKPAQEARPRIRERLDRLERYEATTAYPFLLDVYHEYEKNTLAETDFIAILDVLESFLIRRFICGVATSGLTKIFPSLYAQARRQNSLLDGVRLTLRDKNFPRDKQFEEQFVVAKIYGGDRSAKAKLMLERLEMSFAHKEAVPPAGLTIEHVMPRTPTDWWRQHLGEDWEAVHDEWLDTVGNLTLTGYNSELSNSDFPTKKEWLRKSHVELNDYFTTVDAWDEQAIACRGELLAERAVKIWPDLAPMEAENTGEVIADEDVQEDVKVLFAQVTDHFGGEKERLGKGSRYICRVGDGKLLNIKYSKPHSSYYWFGLHASLWVDIGKTDVTHIVFILLPHGFVTVPVAVMKEYLVEAGSSTRTDGTIRHYHVLISTGGKPFLFHHGKATRYPLEGYYRRFGGVTEH